MVLGEALASVLHETADGESSILREIGGIIHDNLNDTENLDKKLVGSLGTAASKVFESTGGATKNTGRRIGNIFHGILDGISGTIKSAVILFILFSGYISTDILLLERAINLQINAHKSKLILQQTTHYSMKTQTHQLCHVIML